MNFIVSVDRPLLVYQTLEMTSDTLSSHWNFSLSGVPPGKLSTRGMTNVEPRPSRFAVTGEKVIERSASVPSSTFRYLPEEIQLLVLQYALPAWSLRLSTSGGHSSCISTPPERTSKLQYVAYRTAHISHGNPNDKPSVQYPAFKSALFLVDHRMAEQANKAARRTFTGDLHIDYVVRAPCAETCTDCLCQNHESNIAKKRQGLDEMLKLITTVHCKGNGFTGFDVDLLEIFPELKIVVAYHQSVLYDGTTYGFGNEEFFIQVLSEEKLNILMLATMAQWQKSTLHNAKVKQLCQHGMKTIVEMTVTVGRTPMAFSFITVFLLEEDRNDAVRILGRYSMNKWNRSSRFKSFVYFKALQSFNQ